MRRMSLSIAAALIIVLAATELRASSAGSASVQASSSPAKKTCHYVTKVVHGKKTRVKVCTKPKAKPTATPAPTPTPTSLHLIDAGGYVWVDGAGNVYISSGEGTNGRVSKLSPTGSLLATFQSDLDGATGLAVDGQGNVYVADLGSDRIVKFSGSGKQLGTLGGPHLAQGDLSAPGGIGLDGLGHLYVADSNNSRIQEFTLDGQFVGTIGSYGADAGQLERPLDVAVDGQGNLFVTDSYNNRVEEFAPTGAMVNVWGSEGSGAGQFEHPSGITLDTSGAIYVADTGNRRLQKFSADGTPLAQWSTGDYQPVSPGVDSSGNVYVTEDVAGGAAGYGVAKYAPDGRLLSVWR